MGLFDGGQSLTSSIGAAQNAFGAAGGVVNLAGNLGGALDIAQTGDIGAAFRSINLPAAGEAIGDVMSAVAAFSDDANSNDWRVRLSIPNWSSFRKSPVLSPLKDSGGLIFPYTPTIAMSSSATYGKISTTHTNFNYNAFQNSDPGTITITAPMNVEDKTQGLYWIAAMHYLRSMTKMFAGSDPKAGNPPPVVFLNGYGNYVFKNVPVVVTNFQTTLPNDCDYIGVDVVGSAAGAVQGVTDSLGGLAGSLGSAFPSLSGLSSTVSSIAGDVGSIAGLAGTFGIGGTTSGGVAHVPTKSSFIVTLQPMYSRNSSKNFSLDRFVTGGYLNNSFGYI
jgi:hypothetical protein